MRVWTAILTTCFFSLILLVLPAFQGLPAYLYFFQPEWLALTLSYWVLAAPEKVGLMTAFWLGFAADLATGTPLGEHGLVYLMLVLFFRRPTIKCECYPSGSRRLSLLLPC